MAQDVIAYTKVKYMCVPTDVINVWTAKSVIFCVNLVVFGPQCVFVSIILKPTESRKMLTDKHPWIYELHKGGFRGEEHKETDEYKE